MSLVNAVALSLAYGASDIFEQCSFRIAAGDRIGLVGPNGAGKTSLLRLIAGSEPPTGGRLHPQRGLKIGYVPQQPELTPGRTVYEEVASVFAALRRMEEELLEAGEALAQAGDSAEAASARYAELSHRFEHDGGYTYEGEIRRTLQGLGVAPALWQQPVDRLSGGEQARVALAKAILERPDLLLLDEPTNHLDLEGIVWLEGMLRAWRGAFLVVSHDRYFLEQVVNQVWETVGLGLEFFPGSFTTYERLRAERRQREQIEYAAQAEEIARQEELVRRYGVGQRAKWAKGLEKRISHIERLERPRETATVSLSLGRALRSGRVVLALADLSVQHPGERSRVLLHLPQRLEIERGQRVAILGPNGSGKTTLLRLITGELPVRHGSISLGYNVHLAYYRQGSEHLDEQATVLAELLESRNLPIAEARNLLARFLFRSADIEKQVSMLSGGERSRLALAKLSVSGANFLLLDEPTNHLDIASQEALETVLSGFDGTVLLVSHDRRFVDTVATDLWLIEDARLTPFAGNFSAYRAQREAAVAAARPAPAAPTVPRRVEQRSRSGEARLSRFEENVTGLETLMADVSRQLAAASERQDALEVARLGRLYVETEQALEQALHAWEEAVATVG